MNKKTRFLLAVFFQLAILSGIMLYHRSLTKNFEVLLRVGPVDPTSPLRGDYLNLHYPDVSRIEISGLEHPLTAGDIVYLPLRQNERFWGPAPEAKAARTKPKTGVFLKGIVERATSSGIEIRYGIESYFIPEGSGRQIKWGKDDYAVVAVDKNGNPALVRLFIDNRRFPH